MDYIKIGNSMYGNSFDQVRRENAAVKEADEFANLFTDKSQKCPYSAMAKDGVIEYNGVIFNCDYKHNAITLGDMNDPKQVLKIPLPSGGSLHVNINNIDELGKAAGMFTPEDLNAIMRAIHQHNHCARKLNEIEEEEDAAFAEAESGEKPEKVEDAEQDMQKEHAVAARLWERYRMEGNAKKEWACRF